jgi:hypothetical protein
MDYIEDDVRNIGNEVKSIGSDVVKFENDNSDIENAAKRCTFARNRNVFALGREGDSQEKFYLQLKEIVIHLDWYLPWRSIRHGDATLGTPGGDERIKITQDLINQIRWQS